MNKKIHIIANGIEQIIRGEDISHDYDPSYFQKIFKQHVGLTPAELKRFLSYQSARSFLLNGHTTLDAAYRAGLSGNGRLHDLFVNYESITPGNVKTRGAGVEIYFGVADTLFGRMMLAQTVRGICWIGFEVEGNMDYSESRMRNFFSSAQFKQDNDRIADNANKINDVINGTLAGNKIPLDIYGTNFQIQVWRALLQIPMGSVVSYQSIAKYIGNERASRAVGTAVGANPISLLIPCHRVIQSTGIVENYGWGTPRKKILLGIESGITQNDKTSSMV